MLRLQRQPEEFQALEWDGGPPWEFRLDIVHATRDESFSIDGALVRGDERLPIREPSMVLPSGYLFHRGRVARLDAKGAFAWLSQLRGSGAVTIPPDATGRLVDVLARSGVDPSELPPELQFEIVAVRPRPSVSIRGDAQRHAAASLSAAVTFDYDGLAVLPEMPGSVFDQEQRRLVRRDAAFEQQALAQLAQAGFARHWDYLAARQGYAIAPSQLGHAVRTLVPAGWRIEAEGRAFRPAQKMTSEVRSGIDWFELHGTVDFGDGQSAALPRLLEALQAGRSTVTLDDGSEGMVPEEWLRRFAGIASAGEAAARSRALPRVAGGAARRSPRRHAVGAPGRALRPRARRTLDLRRPDATRCGQVVQRAAARLPARRARLARRSCAASASAAASPTTWASARRSWCSPARSPARGARADRAVARRRPALGAVQLGRRRPRASRRSCGCSTSAASAAISTPSPAITSC